MKLRKLTATRVLFMLPSLFFFLVFALGPMLMAGYMSFLNWDGITTPKFIGWGNWIQLFHDPVAAESLGLTLKMMVVTWLIQTPVSMAVGVFLAGRERWRAILGVFYFFPLLFSSAAIGLTWEYLLNPNFGLVDSLFQKLGLTMFVKDWLGEPHLAFYTLAVVIAWQFIPFHTLLYQAGTLQIPESLFDAAKIDGATSYHVFRHVILPQLRYTITTSSLLMLTGALTYFDLIYVMTNGGPGYSTTILPMYMYKSAFVDLEVGYGSVLAVVLAALGIVLSLIMLRTTGFSRMESQMEGA
ncbi:hypothetical protein TPY_1927 [Sulfobacillus acidophilus TPY]|uniref:ABC-type transporter, integral membrane subunit n=1 Tax=Sulfobacillus acidophilus (strain ATCC 700253 / DSM 10332 / NAL) TaxID=679936 RepID=G8TSZ9_SULAD|nr:hypothetical protein TPY_1927 [Sulfobacillus acidophilus TPY]AEW05614.1 ABC-type transporter, integral membrane subunit [Sulfobacillus acidophilus DSM 10332]